MLVLYTVCFDSVVSCLMCTSFILKFALAVVQHYFWYYKWCSARFVLGEVYKLIFIVNPLNSVLNPICHLLALLGARHILHISRIRVKNKKVFCRKFLTLVSFIKKNPTRCNNVSKFYYSIFIWSSTCFGRHNALHQEPKTALAASGFSLSGTYCAWQHPPSKHPTTSHV
jgi:hypothetical protein